MNENMHWLSSNVLEAQINLSRGFFDARTTYESIIETMQERKLNKVHLLLDISGLELNIININLLSSLLLPLYIDKAIGWGILYGSDEAITQMLGTSMMISVGMRLKNTLYREDAIDMLIEKGVSLPVI